jgi:hypothetical protein
MLKGVQSIVGYFGLGKFVELELLSKVGYYKIGYFPSLPIHMSIYPLMRYMLRMLVVE